MKRPSRHTLSRVALAIAVLGAAASLTLLGPAQAASTVTEALLSNTGQTQHADSGATMGPSNSHAEHAAQAFTTGTDTGGYELSSIGIKFSEISATAAPDSFLDLDLKVSVHVGGRYNGADIPGARHCTGNLVNPDNLVNAVATTPSAVYTFTVDPDNPCTLAANSTYYIKVRLDQRLDNGVPKSRGSIVWDYTGSTTLDDGAAAGWSIGGGFFQSIIFGEINWQSVSGKTLQVEINTEVTVAGLIIDPTELDIEEGDSASYTVKLAAAPAGDVTVTIGGHDNTDATLSGSGLTGSDLTFTTSNWNNLQTITVTAAEDGDNDDEAAIDLTHTASSTGDTNYDNLTGSTVTVTIEDDDEAGLIIEPTDLAIGEGVAAVPDGNNYLVPAGYTYTVKLATEPDADVDVEITGHASTSAVLTGVNNDTLTFTSSNWDMAQTVVVTADEDDDDDETVTLSHEASSTGDNDYDGLAGSDVTVTITDNDGAGLIFDIDPLELTVDEEGSASYTVRLASKPEATVSVVLTGQSGSDVSLTGDVQTNTLQFAPDDWNTPQTVTVDAGEDVGTTEDEVFLRYTATSTGDTEYNNLTDDLVKVTITDNDSPAVAINPTAIDVDEGGSGRYTVQLVTQPSANVTVTVPANSGASLSGGALTRDLTFNSGNWNVPQTVTVTAHEDDDARNGAVDISHSSSGADYVNLIISDVGVTILDDDEAELVIDPTEIDVDEEGSASYTVKLVTAPSVDVTVDIDGHVGTDASLSGSNVSNDALTFTPPELGHAPDRHRRGCRRRRHR
ncbi:hypothetical protein [Candidatus Poriferisodalis sp.]|uniref:hypothetical protein n=1 Tax=Candidatus Poriferisodalis sp. TaxID=3101277 RepID=UPI003C6F38A4